MMTREEAEAIYDAGKETVVHVLLIMDARIHALEERVQTLENQLAKNSRNSGKPPSSDGFKKPAPKSLRKKGTRKSGGQPGHTGHTLKMADSPDHTEVHRVTESKTYACGCLNKAAFPEGVNAPVQYGEGIKAAAVYLKNYQYLPYERTCELLDDFFGCSMSEGTLANIIAQSHELAADPVEKIKELVERATVAHFDETGSRVEGKLWWLHSASTAHATYYDIHRKRGGEAFDDIGILPDFTGRAIHDFWKPYFGYDCLHGLCNAHHLRELIFVHERHQQHWADRMIDCLLDIKDAVDLARQTTVRLDRRQIQNFEARYQQILDEGYAQNPLSAQPPGKKKNTGTPQEDQSTRPAHDEGAAENLGDVPNRGWRQSLLPHSKLHLYRPQKRRRCHGCADPPVQRQPVRSGFRHLPTTPQTSCSRRSRSHSCPHNPGGAGPDLLQS